MRRSFDSEDGGRAACTISSIDDTYRSRVDGEATPDGSGIVLEQSPPRTLREHHAPFPGVGSRKGPSEKHLRPRRREVLDVTDDAVTASAVARCSTRRLVSPLADRLVKA